MGANRCVLTCGLLAALSAMWLASPALGDTTYKKSSSTGSASASSANRSSTGTRDSRTGRDPVASVFALPPGTKLNDKQQAAYDKLKSENESALRSSISMIQSKDKDQQTKGLKQNKEVRAKVRAGMKTILAMPSVEAQQNAMKAQQEAARAYAARRSYSSGSSSRSGCPCGR